MADLHRDPKKSRNGFDPLEVPGCITVKSYRGERLTDGTCSVAVELSTFLRNATEPLLTTFHPFASGLRVHAQEAMRFAWGDEETGSAQLALMLLLDALQDVNLASRWRHEFHRQVVARWPDSWTISEHEIRAFIEQQAK